MDVKFINPFVMAIRQVFKTMANTEIQVQKPKVASPNEGCDVSGVIGFSGDATGACILCFPKEVACKLASSFAGVELNIGDADFADAIGELANMVAGSAKAQFIGLEVSISLPSVVIGTHHNVAVTTQPSNAPRLQIPCSCSLGDFHVEVAMVVNKKQTAPTAAATSGARS
ncbi:MAG: hypothetical protein HJJLKODD_00549 [Phycisphaerae bacterium]|nr:hypothetical protein [Phycisphaerae bacterium]